MVAIFWDYENCNPPSNTSGYLIVRQIRNVAQRFGAVKLFKAYLDFSQSSSAKTIILRSELQTSGVSLTDCPHNGKKDVADNMILVDMLSYAMDNPPPSTLVLITGDRDFAYAVAMLRLRQYSVVVVAPTMPQPHISLRSQASILLSWNSDILCQAERHSNANQLNHNCNSSPLPELCTVQSRAARRSSVTLGLPSPSPPNTVSDITSTWTNSHLAIPDDSVSPNGLLLKTSRPVTDAGPNVNFPEEWVHLSRDGDCRNPYLEGKGLLEDDWTEICSERGHSVSPTHVTAEVEGQNPPSASSTSDVGGAVEETFIVDDEFINVNILATFKPAERPNSTPIPEPGSVSVTRMYDPLPHIPSHRLSTTSESGIQLADRDTLPRRDEDQQTGEGVSGSNSSAALPLRSELDLPKPNHDIVPETNPGPNVVQTSAPMTTICPPVAHAASVVSCPPHRPSASSTKEASPPLNRSRSFSTLVDILKAAHKKGVSLPTRNSVAALLLRLDPAVYQRSGVKGFDEYAALAHGAGLVELGVATNGESWVKLRFDLPEARADPPPPPPPSKFAVLVDILNEEHSAGHKRPSRSTVATSLQKRAPQAFRQAGVSTFRRYCALAAAAGIVKLGMVDNEAWMSLLPRWRKVK